MELWISTNDKEYSKKKVSLKNRLKRIYLHNNYNHF